MIEIKVTKMKNIRDRGLGMIIDRTDPILIETRLGIHTFFIKEDIFVYVLSKHGEQYNVLKHKKVKPCRLFFWIPKEKFILESSSDLGLNIGDSLLLRFTSS